MEQLANLRRQTAMAELKELGWLRHLQWQAEVASTNDQAKQWSVASPSETPALFVADQQTAGRGRGGNAWWSPSGCLMLTLALPVSELPVSAAVHPQLALVIGVALAEAVESVLEGAFVSNFRTQLKWPNDIFYNGRKLAGILIEASSSPSQLPIFAVGIGVNTQIDWRAAPVHLLERSICLSRAAGRAIECEAVLLELVPRVQQQLAIWREQPQAWLASWRGRCMLTNCLVRARVGGQSEVVGRCEGIDPDGHLLLRTEQQLHALTAGEILGWTSG